MFEKKKTIKALDPIGGMRIDPAKAAATREQDGTTFYFSAEGCAKTFDRDPHRYGGAAAAHSH